MYYIGIDLGGTKIAAGLTDEEGSIIAKGSVPTFKDRPYQEIIKDMGQLALRVASEAGVAKENIAAIGVGSPGTPDNKKGVLIYANNLPHFVNVPLREELQKYVAFPVPVQLDNDANCAALAESIAGAAKGTRHSVTVTLGTGVGSGVIIDGRVYSGFNGSAAEMGHMAIVPGGRQCTCKRYGCWETYASATALIDSTIAAMKDSKVIMELTGGGDVNKVDAKTAFDAARLGDPTGQVIVEEYIDYLAMGIINIINIFAPEVVVIGGGVSKEGEYLLSLLCEKVYREVYFKGEPQTRILLAKLGNDAGMVGAAMLGRRI